MLGITKRYRKNGKVCYLARVRVKSGKHLAKTFETKTKAYDWKLTTEAAIKEGRIQFVI